MKSIKTQHTIVG